MTTLTPLRAAAIQTRILRVLVVSHQTGTSRLVRSLLGHDPGVRVQVARSLESASAVLGGSTFDAMIVDDDAWAIDAGRIRSMALKDRPEVAILLLTDSGDANGLPPGDRCSYLRRDLLTHELLTRSLEEALGRSKGTKRRETMARWLELDARTDQLTGLYTRASFEDRLGAVCHAARARGEAVAVMTTNVVGMGALNEAFGERTGDVALRLVAAKVARATRACDCAGRIGGDDFAILLPGADVELARRVARRITQEVDQGNMTRHPGDPAVALNFGFASGRRCSGTALLEAAEAQLTRGGHPGYAEQPSLLEDTDGPSVA